jgi:[FeFe] hydrogenase (group B1/B3)
VFFRNYSATTHFELMVRLIRAFDSDNFADNVYRIPVDMRPKGGKHTRCCVYRDRAILKYRLMALLGFCIEEEEDELVPLSRYAEQSLKRIDTPNPVLTVIDEACNGCVRTRYEATNACRGCLAQACVDVCPKDAVTLVHGKSVIDPDRCIKCGKCMEVCPYHAIVHIPIPCEESCPTGAISKMSNSKETIDYEKCIFCGKCLAACPFNAILERSQLVDVIQEMARGKAVTALVAPAIVGESPSTMGHLVGALKTVGFTRIIEVASGADKTAACEADEFVERMEEGAPFMTSSCCPAYTEFVEKHLPEMKTFVSDTRTPMHYTAKAAKKEHPDAITVFLGPCVAKRKEASDDPYVDHVLTFRELRALFSARDIDIAQCDEAAFDVSGLAEGRGFPVSGGVTEGIKAYIGDRAPLAPIGIDGLDKRSAKKLKSYLKKCPGNFVEIMGCEGGCIAGPSGVEPGKKAGRKLQAFLKESPRAIEE